MGRPPADTGLRQAATPAALITASPRSTRHPPPANPWMINTNVKMRIAGRSAARALGQLPCRLWRHSSHLPRGRRNRSRCPIHKADASQMLSMPSSMPRRCAAALRWPVDGRSDRWHARKASQTPPHPLRGRGHQPLGRAVSGNPIPVANAAKLRRRPRPINIVARLNAASTPTDRRGRACNG